MKKCMIAVLSLSAVMAGYSAVELGTPFSDGMILQREMAVPVWGTAAVGEKVSVSFAGQEKKTVAGKDGKWMVELDKMEASATGREMKVSGENTIVIKDVLVGEVWFASGQSNMECPIWGQNPRYRDGKGAMMINLKIRPLIRWAKNDRLHANAPLKLPRAKWYTYSPASFASKKGNWLSAVAYYYALELHDALGIPVGIVDSSWGGTNIDAWTPKGVYATHPELSDVPLKKKKNTDVSRASCLWNGMVASWTPFAIRGFIWYQGCSNNFEAKRYCDKMHGLYDGWAKEFKNSDLKLYFVELAPFKRSWFELQASQSKFAAEEKNAGMAVVADAGNWHDIHPNDKEVVARRLALLALKRDYGFNIEADSPVLESYKIEKDKFVLSFKNANGWYVYSPDYSTRPAFEIAGPDGKFVKAYLHNVDRTGVVKGKKLYLSAKGVTNPCALRYLATPPYVGTLYNSACLPLGPFEINVKIKPNEFKVKGTPVKVGEAEKIKELEGFKKVYELDIPVKGGYKWKKPSYKVDNSKSTGAFSKVAYLFELEEKDGNVIWIMTSMDAFAANADKIGVPYEANSLAQRKVANLTVRTNLEGIKELTDYDGGNIEFWPSNYSMPAAHNGISGNSSSYDFNDSPSEAGMAIGYGSMQVHDWKNGTVLWAFNNFNVGSVSDVGIGNNTESIHSDWTFMNNANKFKSRRLSVFVK
jgi:sialate O-acetylesterase